MLNCKQACLFLWILFSLSHCSTTSKESQSAGESRTPQPAGNTPKPIPGAPPIPDAPLGKIQVSLPNRPIVKVVPGKNPHWILAEELAGKLTQRLAPGTKDDANPIFQEGLPVQLLYDHPRFIYRLTQSNKAELIDLPVKEGIIADIACGPNTNQLILSMIHTAAGNKIRDRNNISHELLLLEIDDPGTTAKILDRISIPSRFPTLDFTYDMGWNSWTNRYYPFKHTKDVARVVSNAEQVLVVARNQFGVPFYYATTITQGHFAGGTPKPMASRLEALGSNLNDRHAGSYDVNQQLQMAAKVHATWGEQGPVLAIPLASEAAQDLHQYYPTLTIPAYKADLTYVLFLFFDPSLTLSHAMLQELGPLNPLLFPSRPQLSGVVAHGDKAFAYGIWRREDDPSYSDPFILSSHGVHFHKHLVSKGTDAVAMFATGDKLHIGGSTDWSKNPTGWSILGGVGYSASFDLASNEMSSIHIHADFSTPRSEIRQIFTNGDHMCFAGMINGPSTHTADGDLSLLKGDGYITCVP